MIAPSRRFGLQLATADPGTDARASSRCQSALTAELSEIARKCGAVSDEKYSEFRKGYDKLVDSLNTLTAPTGGVKQMLHWKSDRIGSWLQGVRTLHATIKSEPDQFTVKVTSGLEVYGAGFVPKMDSGLLHNRTDAGLLRVWTPGSRFFDDGFVNGADFLAKSKDPKTVRCLTLDGGMSPEQIRDYVSRNSSGGARIVDLSQYRTWRTTPRVRSKATLA